MQAVGPLSKTSVFRRLALLTVTSIYLSTAAADIPRSRPDGQVESAAAAKQRVNDQYGRLPLSFERNEGQSDPG
jgi:hypothetical protein